MVDIKTLPEQIDTTTYSKDDLEPQEWVVFVMHSLILGASVASGGS